MNDSNDPDPKRPRIVIVGAGFAGLAAAKGLAKADADIILVDRHNYHLFQPLLYQVATAALSPAQIAQPIRAIVKKQKNCVVALGEMTGIDIANKTISGPDKTLPYDYLILATGATHTYFSHDEWASVAPGLKSIDDATAIRQRILTAFEKAEITDDETERKALLTFAVIGGGPTGVEMAGAIAELAHHTMRDDFKYIDPRQARVILIEAGPRVLSAFPEKLSSATYKSLIKTGVEVITGRAVTNCTADGVTIGDEFIPSRTIIWGAGVKASPIGEWLNVERDRAGRVIVNPDLTVPNHPDIFVLGDTASFRTTDGNILPGVAQVAMQQGKHAAKVILARLSKQPEPEPFTYHDYGTMATIGRGKAIVNLPYLQISGLIAWLMWGLIHLLPLVGFRNRFIVLTDWVWSYFTHARGVRLITAPRGKHSDL